MGLKIENVHGSCPIQAEGTFDGQRFYFRARGSAWSIEVGEGCETSGSDWYKEGPYGEGPFDAGYMTAEEAKELITLSYQEFQEQRK